MCIDGVGEKFSIYTNIKYLGKNQKYIDYMWKKLTWTKVHTNGSVHDQ